MEGIYLLSAKKKLYTRSQLSFALSLSLSRGSSSLAKLCFIASSTRLDVAEIALASTASSPHAPHPLASSTLHLGPARSSCRRTRNSQHAKLAVFCRMESWSRRKSSPETAVLVSRGGTSLVQAPGSSSCARRTPGQRLHLFIQAHCARLTPRLDLVSDCMGCHARCRVYPGARERAVVRPSRAPRVPPIIRRCRTVPV